MDSDVPELLLHVDYQSDEEVDVEGESASVSLQKQADIHPPVLEREEEQPEAAAAVDEGEPPSASEDVARHELADEDHKVSRRSVDSQEQIIVDEQQVVERLPGALRHDPPVFFTRFRRRQPQLRVQPFYGTAPALESVTAAVRPLVEHRQAFLRERYATHPFRLHDDEENAYGEEEFETDAVYPIWQWNRGTREKKPTGRWCDWRVYDYEVHDEDLLSSPNHHSSTEMTPAEKWAARSRLRRAQAREARFQRSLREEEVVDDSVLSNSSRTNRRRNCAVKVRSHGECEEEAVDQLECAASPSMEEVEIVDEEDILEVISDVSSEEGHVKVCNAAGIRTQVQPEDEEGEAEEPELGDDEEVTHTQLIKEEMSNADDETTEADSSTSTQDAQALSDASALADFAHSLIRSRALSSAKLPVRVVSSLPSCFLPRRSHRTNEGRAELLEESDLLEEAANRRRERQARKEARLARFRLERAEKAFQRQERERERLRAYGAMVAEFQKRKRREMQDAKKEDETFDVLAEKRRKRREYMRNLRAMKKKLLSPSAYEAELAKEREARRRRRMEKLATRPDLIELEKIRSCLRSREMRASWTEAERADRYAKYSEARRKRKEMFRKCSEEQAQSTASVAVEENSLPDSPLPPNRRKYVVSAQNMYMSVANEVEIGQHL